MCSLDNVAAEYNKGSRRKRKIDIIDRQCTARSVHATGEWSESGEMDQKIGKWIYTSIYWLGQILCDIHPLRRHYPLVLWACFKLETKQELNKGFCSIFMWPTIPRRALSTRVSKTRSTRKWCSRRCRYRRNHRIHSWNQIEPEGQPERQPEKSPATSSEQPLAARPMKKPVPLTDGKWNAPLMWSWNDLIVKPADTIPYDRGHHRVKR